MRGERYLVKPGDAARALRSKLLGLAVDQRPFVAGPGLFRPQRPDRQARRRAKTMTANEPGHPGDQAMKIIPAATQPGDQAETAETVGDSWPIPTASRARRWVMDSVTTVAATPAISRAEPRPRTRSPSASARSCRLFLIGSPSIYAAWRARPLGSGA